MTKKVPNDSRVIDPSKPLSYEDSVELRSRIEAYYEQMDLIIKSKGWMVQGVFAVDNTSLGFNYTIGMLPLFGFELLVFALPMPLAGQIFNDLGADLRAGKSLPVGKDMDASRWVQGDPGFDHAYMDVRQPLL